MLVEPSRIIALYEDGSITAQEASWMFIKQTNESNVEEYCLLVSSCPDILEAIWRHVERYAAFPEDQRKTIKCFQMGSWIVRDENDVKSQSERRDKESSLYRRGLETWFQKLRKEEFGHENYCH